jgi:hypothetical protein
MMSQSVKMIKSRIEGFLESDNIQRILLFPQGPFEVLRNIRPFHNALERSFQLLLVDPFFLLPHLELVDTLHIRVEKVHQGVKDGIDGGEGGEGGITLETGVPDGFADNIAVFLFDVSIVVFVIMAASGVRDAVVLAPGFQVPIDELSAVVAVDAFEGDGEGGPDIFKGLLGPLTGLVFQGTELRPAQGDIGNGQGEVGPKVRYSPAA